MHRTESTTFENSLAASEKTFGDAGNINQAFRQAMRVTFRLDLRAKPLLNAELALRGPLQLDQPRMSFNA